MIAGFLLRRIVTVTLCAAAFWAGAKADNLFAGDTPPADGCTAVSAP